MDTRIAVPSSPLRWPTGALARALRGRADEATWVRPAFLGVTALAAFLYLWNLTISGYANTYYAMAAQAAAQSWTAWLFGSLDAGNFITVDKPPLATMLLGLSVRLLGLSSWSILLPQALLGVATVALLFVMARRALGPVAAVLAALIAALTPAAVLIYRYDNPDALLTFLFVAAAWATQRALIDGRTRWLILAGLLLGLAFNTKFLQAYLVVPALGFAYLVAGPPRVLRRLGQSVAFGVTSLLASTPWVALVELLPASARPYIGGSETNSALELLLGYDGLGRIFGIARPGGAAAGPAGGGGAGAGFGGEPGLFRMFNPEFGGQIAWLLPLAILGFVVILWARRHAPRTDLTRAAAILWGGWLAIHVVVFSFMSGIIHPYYTVAMAPAIGVLAGGGLVELWRLRARFAAGGVLLGAAVAGTAALAAVLLARSPEFAPWVAPVALVLGGGAAVLLSVPALRRLPRASLALASLALVALLAGPAAYAADTMQTAYSGGDPTAGPAVVGMRTAFRGGGGGGGGVRPAPPPGGQLPPPGAAGGQGPVQAVGDGGEPVATDQALIDYLVANRGAATWLVAANGSGQAAGLQLASGAPVMAMGGFSGGDPAPTSDELAAFVESGQLRFVLVGGRGPGPGGGRGGTGGSSAVATWVTANCSAVDAVGGGSLYDCAPAA